jgi:L-ascorbate metabolism protein UlaG (beta-lactamase superfamily)
MRLIKFGHSCVRLESDGGVLVIDPGVFSDPSALDGAHAVLVTHEHADHINVDELIKRPGLPIFTNEAVASKLDAIADSVTTVVPGDQFDAAGHRVRAFGGTHARIHPDIPQVANLAFLVNATVYHPGDSLFVPQDTTVDTLLLPVAAPWLKTSEAIDFARTVAPRQAIAIHEAVLSDVGLGIVDNLLANLSRTQFQRLPVGGEINVG